MNKIKKIWSIGAGVGLLICTFAISVSAGASTNTIKNGSIIFGDMYLNAKTSSVYAETVAVSPNSYSSDYIAIVASDCETVIKSTRDYTTAYTMAYNGPYSGYKYAEGTIARGSVIAVANVAVSVS